MAKRGQSKYMAHMRNRDVRKPLVVSGAYKSDTLTRHEAMEEKAQINTAKGKRGGDCNRTQCQRPEAWWYNSTMRAYYCGDCAGAINESCLYKDHIVSFGSKVYVMPPTVIIDDYVEGGHAVLVETADGQRSVVKATDNRKDAEDAAREFYSNADLRGDGSPPFHYGELREKMLKIRGLIQERYPDEELVEFV